MSKETNTQQPQAKKEYTSILERIRRRTGLLVGIVGLALVIFILENLLGSGASLFGSDEMYVGSINGKKIDRNEFAMRLENVLNNYRARNQGRDIDDATRSQAVESVWQQYVNDIVMMPNFDKIGITVGEDELYDAVVMNPVQSIIQNLSDPNTGKVNEQFSRPDGSLDPVKWKQAVQNVTGENEMAVRSMEEQVKGTRYFEKFRSIITKGIYVTTAEAKRSFENKGTMYDISFVARSYDAVSDSAVKLTESDIEKYYNDHSYEYTATEDTRKIEYIAFNVVPSAEDLKNIEADANRAAEEFKTTPIKEDSAFIAQESENGTITIQNLSKKTMIIRDSSVYTAAPGTVFGPYNEGAYYKIYKLEAINSVADSARVRHILVGINDPQTQQPKRSMTQAKAEADSVLALLKEKRASFDSLVVSYSDDMGSKTNGGDYGWFDENKGFVEPFKNAGLMGTKGNISVVETSFGYHIIEVLDVSKSRHNSYRIAQIFKPIAPSDETNQAIFAQANQFAGEHNTGELFDKGAEEKKLTKRLADEIKEGEYMIPGIEGGKELVKWAYSANKGDVSVFSFPDKHVVAKLSGIKNKGKLPLEEVKEDVIVKARKAKKAEVLMAEFNKAGQARSLDDAAKILGEEVKRQENLNYMHGMIEGVGPDKIMIGTVGGLKPKTVTKPTAGEMAAFMLTVNEKKNPPMAMDIAAEKREAEGAIGGRVDYEVFNAIKDISEIEFHKSRID